MISRLIPADQIVCTEVDYAFDKFKNIRKFLINHGGKTRAEMDAHTVANLFANRIT